MKSRASISAIWSLLILLEMTITGCAAAGPIIDTSIPTKDQATMIANAVNTVDARWTAEASLNPSLAPTLVPSATPSPLTPTVTPLSLTLTPTVTLTPTLNPPALAAEVLKVWIYPSTKTEYKGNEGFGIAVYLKNIGSTTWEPGYQLKLARHNGPAEITVQTFADLAVPVAPGGKVEFDLWGFGSETPGKQAYTYKLFTSSGFVVDGSEATVTFTSIP